MQQPSLKVKGFVKTLSREMDIGQRTIQSTIAGHKRTKTVYSPDEKFRTTFKEEN